MSKDEAMAREGYVRHKGRYITSQEKALLEQSDEKHAVDVEWYRKIRQWADWLSGNNQEHRSAAIRNLTDLRDPRAVPTLEKLFRNHPDREVRRLYLRSLKSISGSAPVAALVTQSLQDIDRELRRLARETIPPDQSSLAADLYAGRLQHADNVVVRRAALALDRLADERTIPRLIDALVTRHRYQVRVRDTSNTVSFDTDGSFQMGGGSRGSMLPGDVEAALLAGQLPFGAVVVPPPGTQQTRLVTVRYEHNNAEVLDALKSLTGRDFGFDERTWRLWWQAEKDSPKRE